MHKKIIVIATIALCGLLFGIAGVSLVAVSNDNSVTIAADFKVPSEGENGDTGSTTDVVTKTTYVIEGKFSVLVTTNGNGSVSLPLVKVAVLLGSNGIIVDGFEMYNITFTALPHSGYTVKSWTLTYADGSGGAGGVSQMGTNNKKFGFSVAGQELAHDMNYFDVVYRILHVEFTKDTTPYTLKATVGSDGGGSIPSTYQSQTVINGNLGTIKAVANDGWSFSKWKVTLGTGNGVITDEQNAETTVRVTGGNVTVEAVFVQKTYTLKTSVTPNGLAGTISRSLSASTYAHNTSVKLTAKANSGYILAGWTVQGASNQNLGPTESITVKITANTTVTAIFERDAYTLDVISNPSDAGTFERDLVKQEYQRGDLVTLTLTQNDTIRYLFTGWVVSGSGYSSTNLGTALTLQVQITTNTTVHANFKKIICTLDSNINTYDGNAVATQTGGTLSQNITKSIYNVGETVIFTATVYEGYEIKNWTLIEDGVSTTVNSKDTTFTITLSADTVVIVNFSKMYKLEVG